MASLGGSIVNSFMSGSTFSVGGAHFSSVSSLSGGPLRFETHHDQPVTITVNGEEHTFTGKAYIDADGRFKCGSPTERTVRVEVKRGSLRSMSSDAATIKVVHVEGDTTGGALVENIEAGSGRVRVSGSVAGNIKTMSGAVSVGDAVRGSVKTMSGDITATRIRGSTSTMSGNVRRR